MRNICIFIAETILIIIVFASCNADSERIRRAGSTLFATEQVGRFSAQCSLFLRQKYNHLIAVVPANDSADRLIPVENLAIKLDSFKTDEIDERIIFYYSFFDTISGCASYYYQNQNMEFEPFKCAMVIRTSSNLLVGLYERYERKYYTRYVTNTDLIDFKIIEAIKTSDSSKYFDALIYSSLCGLRPPPHNKHTR
jgi:hypothetical protein